MVVDADECSDAAVARGFQGDGGIFAHIGHACDEDCELMVGQPGDV